MKYLKTFEDIEYDTELNRFSVFLKTFIDIKTGIELSTSSNNIKYRFWYVSTRRKCVFDLEKIDYYHDDLDMYFSLWLDLGIKTKDYIPERLLEIILFISDTVKKYSVGGNIKMSKIDEIMNYLKDNYDTYITANKYNI